MPLLRDIKDHLGSLYLSDHADNPVEWWAWGEDAFDEARRRDLPVFLSVGYAACHWCHVMAHESFEDPAIARLLNESFVSIKVDREERPDVDALYMAATQLVSGHGGWPMSVFMDPGGRPFMAGTYYPPTDRHGQVGFERLLRAMDDAWHTQREAVNAQALELHEALTREVNFIDHLAPHDTPLELNLARRALRQDLVGRLDARGGFGGAPKFPRPSYIEALLEFNDEEAVTAVTLTLDAMSRQGLYDHVDGGFARYSVDSDWHVPHFEKMLSDQALLARAYLRAARAYEQRPQWRDVALDTLHFVLRDMRVHTGYASSLDADAGGVEGSHVTWTPDEVRLALEQHGEQAKFDTVLERWRIVSPGLFESRSIPRLADGAPFVTPSELDGALEALRAYRALRVQPARDEKVVLEWNAMLASALLMSGERELEAEAFTLLKALQRSHFANGRWWRTQHQHAYATSADLAWLVDAYVDAFELTGEDVWLAYANDVAGYVLSHYWDGALPRLDRPDEGAGLFSQCDLVTDLPSRSKEIFDGATPSSHAVACRAFARLALCSDDRQLLSVARRLVDLGASLIATHPSAVVDLVEAAGFAYEGNEVVVPGVSNQLSNHVRLMYMTRSVLVTGTGSSPLLENRIPGFAYVCKQSVCRLPVDSIEALDAQLATLRANGAL
ncbi:MAG: thioredoxin domain-containing protein [Acidimicrobiales bacterium]